MRPYAFGLSALLLLAGCGSPPAVDDAGSDAPEAVDAGSDAGPPIAPAALSEWGFFSDIPHQVPVDGVIPYDVISPLFSDYATKHRFLRVPSGQQVTLDADGDLVFPDGSVIVKTFGFLADLRDPTSLETLVETRLLVRRAGLWVPFIYRYDADMQDAHLYQYGMRVPSTWIDAAGETVSIMYRVPDAVQCANCHGGTDPIHLLGLRVRQLDRTHDYGAGPVNQLDHLVTIGVLASVPAEAERHPLVDPFGTAPLEARTRSYLEANCAHCHRVGGGSDQSGLLLGIDQTSSLRLGICKDPAAAGPGAGGRHVDIQPGLPDASVMVFRVESEIPGIKMPELPTVLHHTEGAALIRSWIAAMPEIVCAGPDGGTSSDAGVDAM